MTVLRTTQQVALVAEQFDAKLRSTLQCIQVLYSEDVVPESQARITQQVVEVLYTSDAVPEARVTQQVLEVLYTAGEAGEEASNTLTFTQDVEVEHIWYAASTLTFAGVAEGFVIGSLGNTIPFTQEVAVSVILSPAAYSAIGFTQSAVASYTRAQDLAHNLEFTQTVVCAKVLEALEASNTFTFTQSVSDFRSVDSVLEFTDSVSWAWGGQKIYPTSTLTFSQSVDVDLIINVSASSTISFISSASTGVIVIGATNISQTLTFSHFAVGTIVGTDRYVMLQAPFPQVEAAVILPAAEFDDKENALGDMKIKRSMDGTRRTYVYRTNSRRLAYTFDMTREKGMELQAFLEMYNAEHLRLQNWKGEVWDVQLLTNPLEFTQNRRNDPEGANVAINLEFEGVKLSG